MPERVKVFFLSALAIALAIPVLGGVGWFIWSVNFSGDIDTDPHYLVGRHFPTNGGLIPYFKWIWAHLFR